MEGVEIHVKHNVFRPRALLSIGLSLITALPTLYLYLALGDVDLFHPFQFILDLFGAVFTSFLYWFPVTIVLFCALAYRITNYKVINENISCPADSLSLVFSHRSLLLAAIHSFASFILACVLTSMLGDRYSDLIIECHASNRCLNEHKWFIVLFCSIIGFVFSVEMTASGGYSVYFYRHEKPVMQILKDTLPSLVKSSTRAVRRASVIYYLVYLLCGGMTASLVRICLFLDNDPNGGLETWWSVFDLRLVYQMYIAGVFIRFMWSLSLFLFHTCIGKHTKLELVESQTTGSLLSALELKQDNLTKMLAFKDLYMLATTYDDERRQRVFSLSMPGGHPKTWNTILTVTKSALNELLNRIVAKNDRLLSAHKGIISHQTSKIETIKPGFQNNASTSTKQAATKHPWYCPSILCKPYADSLAGEMFYDGQKHLWSLRALSYLVTRSFTEDKYGIVQQNLGEIIILFLNLQQATDNLFKMAPALTKSSERLAVNKNSQLTGLELRKQIKLALEHIASTFQPHINHIPALSIDQMKQLRSFIQ